jgi:hypothetical protein
MSVSGGRCVFSGTGHCDRPIPRPEESYRLWCVIVCDLETSRMRRLWSRWAVATEEKLSYVEDGVSKLIRNVRKKLPQLKWPHPQTAVN